LIYHFTLVDSVTNQKKYFKHLKNYDRDRAHICRDRLRQKFNEVCKSDDLKQSLDDESRDGVTSIYIAVVDIEVVDLPTLIRNETRVPVAPFDEVLTEFLQIELVKSRQSTYFAITDSTGHITTLVKNLRLKSRIHSDGGKILQATAYTNAMMLLH